MTFKESQRKKERRRRNDVKIVGSIYVLRVVVRRKEGRKRNKNRGERRRKVE